MTCCWVCDCCLLYSTLVFETISIAKDAFVCSLKKIKQIQESGTNISLAMYDYLHNFPENKSLNTSRDVPHQFQHLTVLTVNNNNNNMFQHVTDTNREHYQGKRIGEFDFGSRPLDRFTEWRICPLVNCVACKSGSVCATFPAKFQRQKRFYSALNEAQRKFWWSAFLVSPQMVSLRRKLAVNSIAHNLCHKYCIITLHYYLETICMDGNLRGHFIKRIRF